MPNFVQGEGDKEPGRGKSRRSTRNRGRKYGSIGNRDPQGGNCTDAHCNGVRCRRGSHCKGMPGVPGSCHCVVNQPSQNQPGQCGTNHDCHPGQVCRHRQCVDVTGSPGTYPGIPGYAGTCYGCDGIDGSGAFMCVESSAGGSYNPQPPNMICSTETSQPCGLYDCNGVSPMWPQPANPPNSYGPYEGGAIVDGCGNCVSSLDEMCNDGCY